jgi:hypothetical protein
MGEFGASRMATDTRWRAAVLAAGLLCPDQFRRVVQGYAAWQDADTLPS